MNRKLVLVSFIIFTSIFLILYSISTTAAPPPPVDSDHEQEKELIKEAVNQAIDGQREFVLGYLVNDVQITGVELSQDETQGILYLEMVDPETGEVLPIEPGLAFAVSSEEGWEIVLPADPTWIDHVKDAPTELLNEVQKNVFIEMYNYEIQAVEGPYSGYLLPWEAGRTVYLSQSTAHDHPLRVPSGSAHYSFDFYISGTMYPIRASKSGTVWRARWEVPNHDASDMGNYIVLKDESTTPTTYQLYLHLAKDSIPEELRTIGTYVPQGQFIGIADDTGVSTGHHLHFHVHTYPDSYWGTSVDITFDDVDINGGRPRIASDLPYCTRPGDVCNQFRNAYVSQNIAPGDTIPPIGDLFEPGTGLVVTSDSVHFDGWAFDEDSGVHSTKLMAYFENSWREVGNEIPGNTFNGEWDLCADQVPDGPVSMALKIRDNAGNYSDSLPGLTHFEKDFECPQSLIACTPGPDQIAVYTSPDFQGLCQVFGIGGYANISPDIDINIESIQTGANVLAEIFTGVIYSGRRDSIHTDDSDLDDNLVRGDQIRSIMVTPKSASLLAPEPLIYPLPGDQFASGDSLSFSWGYSGPGKEFQVDVLGPTAVNSGWLPTTYWIANNIQLAEGEYTWMVKTRSCPTCESSWSDTANFEITPAPPAMLSTAAPFSDSFESGPGNWQEPTGLWNLLNDPAKARSSNHAWYYGIPTDYHYDSGTPNSGTLTSKPILVPEVNYQLKFWYHHITEDPGTNWDQRWLQISTNGSPFENVLKLSNDVTNYWLQASLDLSPYAGQEIQARFFFTTLDSDHNAEYEGWLIDDFEIIQEIQPTCDDGNDQPQNAEMINYNQTLSREICPSGDIDNYKFDGLAGDHIVLDIDTQASGSVDNLDLYLFLLDGDTRSELAQHDDEILGTVLDPHLGYQLKRDGTYYVRARLWSHPSYGGEDFDYQITLSKDNSPPQGSITQPQSNSFVNDSPTINLSATASDAESGIQQVEFLYHSGDWQSSNWELIDIDQDGTNGWGLTLDADDYPEGEGAAFFAKIYDWAGNWTGSGVWEVGFDRTPPITSMQSLDPVQQSTAIQLQWSGTDNISGMDFYQLQSKVNGWDWSNILPSPSSAHNSHWLIGQPSSEYDFRMRGVDIAGNLENFPQSPETSTSIPGPAILCSSPDNWDSSGDDNSPGNSLQVNLLAEPTEHNFCNPLTADRLDDEDWVKFEVEPGQDYLIESLPTAEMTAAVLELYAEDGTTLITTAESAGLNEKARIIWTSDRSGIVYLRVRHLDGRIAGNAVTYLLKVNKFLPTFMPFVHR